MSKLPATEQSDAAPAQTAPQDDKKQAAERRRFEYELEDDEVCEALAALHRQKQG
jgi:hypothetical protein